MSGQGQLPPLDSGQMFADGVYFMDGGAAGQEHLDGFLFVGQGQTRTGRRQQGGTTAGQQADNKVIFTCLCNEFAVFFRHPLDHFYPVRDDRPPPVICGKDPQHGHT